MVNLDARLAEVTAAYDVGHLALGGFSDGASYALSLGLANGNLVVTPEMLATAVGGWLDG